MASRAKTVICLLRNDLRLQDNEVGIYHKANVIEQMDHALISSVGAMADRRAEGIRRVRDCLSRS